RGRRMARALARVTAGGAGGRAISARREPGAAATGGWPGAADDPRGRPEAPLGWPPQLAATQRAARIRRAGPQRSTAGPLLDLSQTRRGQFWQRLRALRLSAG